MAWRINQWQSRRQFINAGACKLNQIFQYCKQSFRSLAKDPAFQTFSFTFSSQGTSRQRVNVQTRPHFQTHSESLRQARLARLRLRLRPPLRKKVKVRVPALRLQDCTQTPEDCALSGPDIADFWTQGHP